MSCRVDGGKGMTREKVIAGLECLTRVDFAAYATECEKRDCPYKDTDCEIAVMVDAYNLLKAQEPRVMTLEEVKANRLEPIWLETQDDSYFEWALWRAYDDEDMMRFFWGDDGESWRINVPPEEYGKTWRCWTSEPTDEQQKAVKWDA